MELFIKKLNFFFAVYGLLFPFIISFFALFQDWILKIIDKKVSEKVWFVKNPEKKDKVFYWFNSIIGTMIIVSGFLYAFIVLKFSYYLYLCTFNT